jgi:hypothetical protein
MPELTDQQIQELRDQGFNESDILMMQLTGQSLPPSPLGFSYSPQNYSYQEPAQIAVQPTDPDEVPVYGGMSRGAYENSRQGIPAKGPLTPRGIDLAVASGYSPSIFENYGNQDPRLDAKALQAHNTALTAAKNEARIARGAISEIEPISMSDSAESLMNFLGNEYNDLVTNAPYNYAIAKKTVAPVLNYANDVKAKAREAYTTAKPYVQPYVDKAYTAAKPTLDIYKTLADDPEATARGVAMAAADARDYTEREAPNWVAQVSSSLNRGNKFIGSLKDAWRNPEHYLSGGTYDDRLRIQEARERPTPTEMRRPTVEGPVTREQPTQGFSYASNSQVTAPRPNTAVPASSKNKLQQSLPTQQVQQINQQDIGR